MYGGDDGELIGENVIYYLTVYNEPYVQPAEPEDLDVEGLLRGIYRYAPARRAPTGPQVRLARFRRRAAVGAARPATCSPRSGASAPRCGR